MPSPESAEREQLALARTHRRIARQYRRQAAGLQVMTWLGALLLLAVGSALLFSGPHPAGAQLLGFCLLGLGVCGAAGQVARARNVPPEPRTTLLDGVPANAFARSNADFTAGMAMLICVALTLAGWTFLLFQDRHVPLGVALAAVAGWLTYAVIEWVSGRYIAGGLWLTPAGFTYRSRGLQTTLAWDDLADLWANPFAEEVLFHTRTPTSQAHHTYRAGPWHGEKHAGAGKGRLNTSGIALTPEALAQMLDYYAHTPDARATLGTTRSLPTVTAGGPS